MEANKRLHGPCTKAKKASLFLLLIVALFSGNADGKLQNPDDVCVTEECTMAAGEMLKSMDKSVNPCDDFYQFSCGNWGRHNPIPEYTSSWYEIFRLEEVMSRRIKEILESNVTEADPLPLQQAKRFYDSCMKHDSPDQSELRNLIDLVLKIDEIDNNNVGPKIGEVRRLTDLQLFIYNYVELDQDDSSKHILYIDQPSFGLNRGYLVVDNHPYKILYQELIQKVWPLVYEDLEPNFDLVGLANSIVEFETALANITTPPEDRRNFTAIFNRITVEQLQSLNPSPRINWTEYMTEIFKDVVEQYDVVLGDISSLEVGLFDTEYYEKLGDLLESFLSANPRILENYIKWRVMFAFGNDVNERLREVFFEFSKKTTGIESQTPRWRQCSDKANAAYGMVISRPYVQEALGDGFFTQMSEMIQDIKNGFYELLDEADWIASEETRMKARQKGDKMINFIGYPDWLIDNSTALELYYYGLKLNSEGNYFQSTLDIAKWKSMGTLRNVKEPKDPNRWVVDPTVVNAFYYPYANSITFPAGILQPPFYFPGKPIQALNYAAVGMAIGHEITHGFDDLGRQYDGDGNLMNWWDEETLKQYVSRAECFVSQYSSYKIEELNMTLNGRNPLGENIADNGGLREAFRAYKSYVARNGEEQKLPGLDYTPEQIFFIAFAQIWCALDTPEALEAILLTMGYTPFPFRVRGALDNSIEFAQTWNCPLPDESKICKIW